MISPLAPFLIQHFNLDFYAPFHATLMQHAAIPKSSEKIYNGFRFRG